MIDARTLLLTAALAIAGCGDEETPQGSPGAGPVAVTPELSGRVAFEPAEPATRRTLVSLPGEVVLPSDAHVSPAPPLPGRLVRWLVAVGDPVAPGDPLAAMQSPELADLAATRRELRRVVSARKKLVASRRAQLEAGLVGVHELREAQAAASEAAAKLAAVREQLDARRELGADGATWTWRSTVRGTVSELACAPGSPASGSCLTVLDTGRAQLRVRVPERYVAAIGADVVARLRPVSDPEVARELRFARRAPALDARSRTLAHFFAADPSAQPLLPGTSGRVDLIATAAPDLLAIPRTALTAVDGADAVFVAGADEDGTDARAVRVDVVGRHDGVALVRAAEGEALAAGDRVAVRGVLLLKSLNLLAED